MWLNVSLKMTNYFDIHAQNYDAIFTHSNIGKAQRNRVYFFLSEIIKEQNLNILEVNCGTGEDAHYLSQKGHRVLATDISSEMILQAKKKHPAIQFKTLDVTKFPSEILEKKFDVIFSNFGGLNCLSKNQLKEFLDISETLLTPNGKIVLVIMPKKTIWERLYFLLKFQPKKAFRRNTNASIPANVEEIQVPTWYYNPKDVVTLAKEKLSTTAIRPIGIAIPPSYLEPFFRKRKWFLSILTTIESWFSNAFWAKYADHYLITFHKK